MATKAHDSLVETAVAPGDPAAKAVLQLPGVAFDDEYVCGLGVWERLKDSAHYPRLRACAELLRKHAPGGSVLELGCGEALLLRHLHPQDYRQWLGFDASPLAIERARACADGHAQFAVGDMRTLDLTGQFDAIIFNQAIDHLPDRVILLLRYARHLKPGGVIIISTCDADDSATAWYEMHFVARAIDSAVAKNDHGTWVCEVLRMR